MAIEDDDTLPSVPPPPPQPKTKELPAVPQWAAELTMMVRRIGSNVDNVISAVDVLRDRVNAHDARFAEQETRASNVSIRVKSASQFDLDQSAQLAQERAAREALAEKVDDIAKTNEVQLAILGRLDKVARNPIVKTLAAMLATAVITWLASHGVHIQ